MRIHHLDCGTGCPVGGALFDGAEPRAGMAVRRADGGWRLHVGHICVHPRGMGRARRRCTLGLAGSQRQMEVDTRARMNSPQRLRALSMERPSEATTTCAHNPIELERCHARRPL